MQTTATNQAEILVLAKIATEKINESKTEIKAQFCFFFPNMRKRPLKIYGKTNKGNIKSNEKIGGKQKRQ